MVYAALADSISMRKLLVAGIAMSALGSAIGFAFQGVWELVLVGRIIQTCGLAAAETLYVIYVTKYLSKADQKTYLGFSTSAFQGALLIGTLTSGIMATYVSWTAMFLASLLIAAALILPALFVGQSVAVIVISMLLFPSGFALIYAPLVATAVGDIPPEKSGVAIGFYNLVINIAVPVGIAYTAKLVDLGPTFLSGLSQTVNGAEAVVATVLWILAGIVLVGLAIWLVADGVLSHRETVRETVPA